MGAGPLPRRAVDALLRLAAGAAIVAVVAATSFLALRAPVAGLYDVLPTGARAAPAYVAAGLLLVLLMVLAIRRGRGVLGVMARLIVLLLGVFHVWVAGVRALAAREDARATRHWPPRLADTVGTNLAVLSAPERAAWGVRVAAHLVTGVGAAADGVVPDDWPFPVDVHLGYERDHQGVLRVWSRASDGHAECVSIPRLQSPARDRTRCEDVHTAPSSVAFSAPVRSPDGLVRSELPVVGAAWRQYRATGARAGIAVRDTGSATGWRRQVDGPLRSSAIAVGDLVLIGSHGTGTLTAIDAASGTARWVARVPNWVHQDPVTDGAVVVVSFGDNDASFQGRAPSGVAAFALATGERLWTRFDESSVMTSAVMPDSTIVYSTAIGWVRKRSVLTGALIAERMLPGAVVMAPPAATGDTIVFSLDHDGACALLMSTLEPLWCRTVPHLRMMGHAAPAIGDGHVILSGAGSTRTPTWAEFRALPLALQWRLIVAAIRPAAIETPSGQVFVSLALRDGQVQWRSPLFANPRLVEGHIAGTAVLGRETGVIVLPVADTVVSFRLADGAVLWTGSGHGARGPALVTGDRVVVAGRDGTIVVRDVMTGAVTCRVTREVGWDRAGPVQSGSLLVFGDLKGGVEAIPERALRTCATQ
jgi:outer membrane protein assembly factor BamB